MEGAAAWQLPWDFTARASRLRWLHALTAGVEHWVDLPVVREGRVILTRTAGAHSVAVPEHVMAVVLAFSRRLHIALHHQFLRRWDRSAAVGDELAGRVMGILGLGHIGRALAERASRFGMRVVGTKRTVEPVSHVELMVPPDRSDEVIQEADYLVVLLPLTPATPGVLGAREFRLMKPTSVLVNVARGAVVREMDLVAALRAGWIAGAALDVLEEEPPPPDSRLYDLPQVLLTPHGAGVSPRYFDRITAVFAGNLRRFVRGQPLQHVVDPGRGY